MLGKLLHYSGITDLSQLKVTVTFGGQIHMRPTGSHPVLYCNQWWKNWVPSGLSFILVSIKMNIIFYMEIDDLVRI